MPGEKAEVVDSDLTASLTSDRLLRILTPGQPDYLLHIEFQVSYDPKLCHRVLAYHVAAGYKYCVPVISVVVLLRRKANGPAIVDQFRFGAVQLDLEVVRLWEHSPDEVLSGPPTLLPLLPLTNVDLRQLSSYVTAAQAISARMPAADERNVWRRMDLLLGLIVKREQRHDLLKGVFQMLDLRESDAYQEILEEGQALGEARGEARGKAEAERAILLRLGAKRLGEPTEITRQTIADITSIDRLNELVDRLLDVESWEDLLA